MRKAFVFSQTSWHTDLEQEYAKWVNELLEKYPDAKFEIHQSLGSFISQRDEIEWVKVLTLIIVHTEEP